MSEHRDIPVIVHELMRAATGNPITVRSLDGEEFTLRLATAAELQQFQRDAVASLAAKGIDVSPPPMSRQRAEELCAPLDLESTR